MNVQLQEALADVEELATLEALIYEGNEMPKPELSAIANALTLLPKLFQILPVRYNITPTERRGVAIDVPMQRGAAVAVECAPDDTVYCFVTIDGNRRRAKFYQMDGLPDVFITKALQDMAPSIYTDRLERLHELGKEDGIEPNSLSEQDFLDFIRIKPQTKQASLVLLNNGNLRASWGDIGREEIDIQFCGNGVVQYTMAWNSGFDTAVETQQSDFNNLLGIIESRGLNHLLYGE